MTVTEKFIDLQKGWPSPRLLPSQALQEAAFATLSNPTRATDSMLYGPSIGDPALRKGVASWLSELYSLRSQPSPSQNDHHESTKLNPISSDRISITNGASQNLASIMEAFTDPVYTRRIWMVEPTYFHACTIFEDAGFQGRLVGVPEDEEGLDVQFLRRQMEFVDAEAETEAEGEKDRRSSFKQSPRYEKLYRHVIYLVPTFSNPSAKTYTLSRRESLVRLAREFNALLVTDDCYDFLSWALESPSVSPLANGNGKKSTSTSNPSPPPPRLVDIDASLPKGDTQWGHAVSNGSFSKVVGPGLRCGWAEATPAFIKRLNLVGATVSGGAPGQFSSVLIEHVLRSGSLTSHINDVLIPTYRSRCFAMREVIRESLVPLGVQIDTGLPYLSLSSSREINKPAETIGGFFLYIVFPEGIEADQVAKVALEEYNLRFLSAGAMAVRGSPNNYSEALLKRGGRLCWAWEEEEDIVEGIRRIGRVLQERFQ
ncbi:aminotransferase [Aspergillus stella-maris]|uniref:aminotransferase n=1 Tax=Aspergillus stella-maris TaxID=1810926 RepID=UPI003CCD1A8B